MRNITLSWNGLELEGEIGSQIPHDKYKQITYINLKSPFTGICRIFGECKVGVTCGEYTIIKLDEKEIKESIVGKFYKVDDNSYSVNITKAEAGNVKEIRALLANCYHRQAPSAIGKIVSDPFICKILFKDTLQDIKMILIEFENNTYSVFYNENSVI